MNFGLGYSSGQSTIDPQYLIVPGRTFGPIQLGGSIKDVMQFYGKEKSSNPSQGYTRYYFEKPDLFVWASRDGKVVGINGFNPAYKTETGIGVSSTIVDLQQAYGEPCRKKPHTGQVKEQAGMLLQYVVYTSGPAAGFNGTLDLRQSIPTFVIIGNDLPGVAADECS